MTGSDRSGLAVAGCSPRKDLATLEHSGADLGVDRVEIPDEGEPARWVHLVCLLSRHGAHTRPIRGRIASTVSHPQPAHAVSSLSGE